LVFTIIQVMNRSSKRYRNKLSIELL